ncbi:MAG: hypothetical protein V7K14_09825 [Nostoc sp.]|uniref:hypothetical protein n=1 Tax=Nostoc sp. TaxID=1180 RepID=UPI002FF8F8CA
MSNDKPLAIALQPFSRQETLRIAWLLSRGTGILRRVSSLLPKREASACRRMPKGL